MPSVRVRSTNGEIRVSAVKGVVTVQQGGELLLSLKPTEAYDLGLALKQVAREILEEER